MLRKWAAVLRITRTKDDRRKGIAVLKFCLLLMEKLSRVAPKTPGGFAGGLVVKNLPANAEGTSVIPGSGRSLEVGNGNPLQYSCLGNPMDRGA